MTTTYHVAPFVKGAFGFILMGVMCFSACSDSPDDNSSSTADVESEPIEDVSDQTTSDDVGDQTTNDEPEVNADLREDDEPDEQPDEIAEIVCGVPTGGVNLSAYYEDGDFFQFTSRDGDPEAGDTFDALSLEFYYDLGASLETGTFEFTGQNYADCHTCSLAYSGCVQSDSDGSIECESTFLIQSGTLAVTSVGRFGDQFTATLTDAQYAEVTFSNPDDPFDAILVTEGAAKCVDRFEVDARILGVGCGNGELDDDEECDDGFDDNSDTAASACRTDCVDPYCGDNITDEDEDCDDGPEGSETCTRGCKTPSEDCGDGDIDEDEECDNGEDNNSDTEPNACRTDCTLPSCGDGVTDEDEACDEGLNNGKTHYHCSTNCNPCTYDDLPDGPDTAVHFSNTTCDGCDQVIYVARDTDPPGAHNSVSVEVYYDYGAKETVGDYSAFDFADPPAWAFLGTQEETRASDYSECNTCSLAARGCTGTPPLVECESQYLIQEGTLNLTQLGRGGDTIAGTLTGARYIEVEIDSDSVATVVDENDDDQPDTSWCVESFTFDTSITAE